MLPAPEVPGTWSKPNETPRKYQSGPSSCAAISEYGRPALPAQREEGARRRPRGIFEAPRDQVFAMDGKAQIGEEQPVFGPSSGLDMVPDTAGAGIGPTRREAHLERQGATGGRVRHGANSLMWIRQLVEAHLSLAG